MKKLALGALFAGLIVACGGDKPKLIDGNTVDAMEACNPLAQTGCLAGEKCAWIDDQDNPPLGHIGCAPNGVVAVDQPCTVGPAGATGYSNCVAGFECVNAVCKQICDHQGGQPKCDTNHACSRYSNLFESGDVSVAGVCDPKCDPLTQELVIGTTKAACGSMNPAAPTAGCFTFDNVDFTCAGIPVAARGLTDRMKAYGPASGGAYVNGCAAGFLPFFIETTGSMVAICAGMCAPLKTDNTLVANALGDPNAIAKLPTEAAPAANSNATCKLGKKGISSTMDPENCHFLWRYNVENNVLINSPYNDTLGVCFAYSHYEYDHDMNPATTPRKYPGCETLPPKGTANCSPPTDTCPDGTAADWPCVNSTEGMALTASSPRGNPAIRDFRVGAYGEGTGLRHLVR